MDRTHLIGTKRDRKDRSRLERLDDDARQDAISNARHAIYEENHQVDSAFVERQLKPESLVPTLVKFPKLQVRCLTPVANEHPDPYPRTHFPIDFQSSA
jgi:hypothetical protein